MSTIEKMKKALGYIVYEGPSAADPDVMIVVIVNCVKRGSNNEKTGPMAQSWILRADIPPNKAIFGPRPSPAHPALDYAVCGACPYAAGRGCYVSLKTICSVWRAYNRCSYMHTSPEEVGAHVAARVKTGHLRGMRAGSYGDPAMVPFEVWEKLLLPVRGVGGKTSGYTHMWNSRYRHEGQEIDPRFKTLLMASAHGGIDAHNAAEEGWRPFAQFNSEADLRISGLAMCPASKEAGHRKTCATCGSQSACNGRKGEEDKRVGVGIVVHGSPITLNLARRRNGVVTELDKARLVEAENTPVMLDWETGVLHV